MPRPYNKLFSPSNSSTTYFASAATAASFTLSHNATPDGYGHKISITGNGATDLSAINVTLVGLDQDGFAQTETFALPNGAATVTSTYFYSSLTSATPASTIGAATVKITYTDAVATPTFPLNWRGGLPILSVIVSGTINYTAQYTDDLVNQGASSPFNWLSDADSPLTGATSSQANGFTVVPIAVRLLINSYSNGATALFQISQKDI